MTNKQKYAQYIDKVYTPIYSKPWWLDALCGSDNWDVWLYENGSEVTAAMPYYNEQRGEYSYITKALLTQNNGIIFKYPDGAKAVAKQIYEEKVIDEACKFIKSLNVDVYEQQFHYSFKNWLPFYWNRYTAITRYTYVIEDLSDIEEVWNNISAKYRSIIRKGEKNAKIKHGLEKEKFYAEHEKVFLKQGLECPFSYDQWINLYDTCKTHNSCEIFYAVEQGGNIASLLFLIWDEQSAYLLLGGSMPDYQKLDTYSALIWESIKYAAELGLKYDFEGSVIKRISKPFREFGGEPKPYFRIRKVFNPDIMRAETEKAIRENLIGVK